MEDSKYPQKIKSGETPMIKHSSSSFTFDKTPIEESPWVELSDKLVEVSEKLRHVPGVFDIYGDDIDSLTEAAKLIKDARGFDIEDTQQALVTMTEDRDEIFANLQELKTLFMKYISHVGEIEGVDFIDDPGGSSVEFTDQERTLLVYIGKQSGVRYPTT